MLLPGGRLYFYFRAIGLIVSLVAGLMVGLAISGIVLMALVVTIDLSK